jgi:hypothetical protein
VRAGVPRAVISDALGWLLATIIGARRQRSCSAARLVKATASTPAALNSVTIRLGAQVSARS